jgi:drug/metabolite transporter (DMT)-like permease
MTSLRTPERTGVALCLLAGVTFSVSPVLVQIACRHGAAVTGVLAWRYLVAAVLLTLVAGRRLRRVSLRAAVAAFVMGAVVYASDSFLFFASLERTSAPLASLVHYAHLAIVVGVTAIAGRERLSRRRLLALAAISAGVAFVGGGAANPDLAGIGLALGSAVVYAVYILLSGRLLRDADPVGLTAILTAGVATTFLVVGGAGGSLGHVGGGVGLACLVAAALIGSVVAVTSFLGGIRLIGPAKASLLVTVEVPVTIALAVVVMGQRLTPAQLVGAAFVVAAIAVLQLPARRPPLRLRLVAPRARVPAATPAALAEAA